MTGQNERRYCDGSKRLLWAKFSVWFGFVARKSLSLRGNAMLNLLKPYVVKSRIWFGLIFLGLSTYITTSAFAASNTAERAKIVRAVNHYFKNLGSLKGTFVQTNPDKKWINGKFYIQRPGKMRFDYKRPSRYRIVADGTWLSIEDPDTDTFNRFQLKSTPFRMLLRQDVNLFRDAKILGHTKRKNVVTLTLADRNPMTSGKIKLLFTTAPRFQLREWTVTDAQGLNTRVRVAHLKSGTKISSSFFKVAPIKFPGYEN